MEYQKLLILLEDSTESSNYINTRSATKVLAKVSEKYEKISKFARSIDTPQAYNFNELQTLVNRASSVNIKFDTRVHMYNVFATDNFSVSLNITNLFNHVMNEIKEHTSHPLSDFDPDEVIGYALSAALRQCTGEISKDGLSLSEFETNYKKNLFCGLDKISFFPNMENLRAQADNIYKCIHAIDNKLLNTHIRSLIDTKNEVINIMAKAIKKNPEISDDVNKYLNCIESAINTTRQIYMFMRNQYTKLDADLKNAVKFIISRHEKEISDAMNESVGLTKDVVVPHCPALSNTISEIIKNQESESLNINTIEAEFEELNRKHMDNMYILLDDEFNKDSNNVEYITYPIINSFTNDILPEIDSMDFNAITNFIVSFSQHCDNNEQKLADSINRMMPFGHTISPKSTNTLNTTTYSDIRKMSEGIIGNKKLTKVNIDNVSENIVLIPNTIRKIQQLIIEMLTLMCSKVSISDIPRKYLYYITIILSICIDIIDDSVIVISKSK